MDLVATLAVDLELPENAARGLAGSVVVLVEALVREQVSFGLAARIAEAVPEATWWQRAAPTLPPGALSMRPLDRPGPGSEFEELLERTGVSSSHVPLLQRRTLEFLATRLDARLVAQISAVVAAARP